MKYLIAIFLSCTILGTFGCRRRPGSVSLSGKWQGTVTESGQSTLVELALRDRPGGIEGTLTILSETGEDIDKGMSFKLVKVERSGKNLKFIVPVTGQIDDDAIAFDLQIEKKYLRGTAHELHEGSSNLPITFEKKD